MELKKLYKSIKEGTATAREFENAIKEEGLICEIIVLIADYYKGDLNAWRKDCDVKFNLEVEQ